MMLSRSATVRARVLLFVGLATLGALLLGWMDWQQIRASEDLSNHLFADVTLQRAAGTLDMVHDGLQATTRAALLAGPAAPEDEASAVRDELADRRKALLLAMDEVVRGAADPAVRLAAEQAHPVVLAYADSAGALVQAALLGAPTLAAQRQRFDVEFKALEVALHSLGRLVEASAGLRIQQRDVLFAAQRQWTLAAVAGQALGLLLLGLGGARALMARLGAEPGALNHFAQEVAGGALHVQFDGATPPAGSVAAALVHMRERLRETVQTIRDGADSVASGSSQIAIGNQDLAERTMRQVHSLRAAAAGMAQVASHVQQTAGHAQAATALAASSSAVAQRGGAAVQRVVVTMAGIADTSQRIAEITTLIDGLAAQTNILALNAAVEAVRAGTQGSGFVAVAAEVRSLAQRSAAAAREIRSLIDSSTAQVASGSQQAAEAGSTMQEVLAQVAGVQRLVAEICQAAQQQNGGITQVDQSVQSLDHGTQQTAALVEQSAAAATMLRDQAGRLAGAVGAFELQRAPLA